ncbi:MAG: XRE family transcriptional regulator [Oenococcus oeni]
MKAFANNIKYLRDKFGFDQLTLAKKVGKKSEGSVSNWEHGNAIPPIGVLSDLAKIFHVTTDDLLNSNLSDKNNQIFNVNASGSLTIPIYSHLFAGMPDGAEEDIIGNIDIPDKIANKYGRKNLLAVKVEGDSMNKVILDGMIAVVNTDDTEVKNGNVYAVIVNGFANTIKRVYKYSDHIRFEPDSFNPANQPFSYRKDEDISIKIVGKLVYIAQDLG